VFPCLKPNKFGLLDFFFLNFGFSDLFSAICLVINLSCIELIVHNLGAVNDWVFCALGIVMFCVS
jgi:hypothetical protein